MANRSTKYHMDAYKVLCTDRIVIYIYISGRTGPWVSTLISFIRPPFFVQCFGAALLRHNIKNVQYVQRDITQTKKCVPVQHSRLHHRCVMQVGGTMWSEYTRWMIWNSYAFSAILLFISFSLSLKSTRYQLGRTNPLWPLPQLCVWDNLLLLDYELKQLILFHIVK